MALNKQNIEKCVEEAEEFISRAKVVIDEMSRSEWYGNKNTAALRRQSLELTHELAALRKR